MKHMRDVESTGRSPRPRNTGADEGTSSQSKDADIARSTRMMSALIVLSRLTGFARTWAQAFAVGATIISSCYTLSNNLLTQLNNLVAGGLLITGFMPVYMAARRDGGQREGNEYISNLIGIISVALGTFVVLSIIFAPQLVWVQSFNATSEFDADLSVWFFRIFAIEFLLYPLSVIFSGVNNADREFFWSNFAPTLNNVIVALSFFLYVALLPVDQWLGLVVLGVGNVLGVVFQVGVQIAPALRRGVRLRPRLDLHDPRLRDTLSIGVPMIAVMITTFAGTSVQTSYALSITAAGSSIMYYAQVWYAVPYSVFSVPLSTALFTELTENHARGDMDSFRGDLARGMSSISFYLIPCALLLIVFSVPLTCVLAGSMTDEQILMTAGYLAFLAPSLPLWGLAGFLQKASSAMGNMRFYAVASLLGAATQIGICVFLAPLFGLPAVALSSVAYQGALTGVTLIVLRRRLGHIGLRSIVVGQLQALGAGVAGLVVGGVILVPLGALDPGASAASALVSCLVAGVPSLLATIAAGAAMGNRTAMGIAGGAQRVMRRIVRR